MYEYELDIEGRTDQRNAQINFSLINLLLSVLPSIMKMHGPKNKMNWTV